MPHQHGFIFLQKELTMMYNEDLSTLILTKDDGVDIFMNCIRWPNKVKLHNSYILKLRVE